MTLFVFFFSHFSGSTELFQSLFILKSLRDRSLDGGGILYWVFLQFLLHKTYDFQIKTRNFNTSFTIYFSMYGFSRLILRAKHFEKLHAVL